MLDARNFHSDADNDNNLLPGIIFFVVALSTYQSAS